MNRKWTYFMAGAGRGLPDARRYGLRRSCRARDQLNKGVQAYRNAKYPEAVERFKTAVRLDPNLPHRTAVSGHRLHEPVHPGRRVPGESRDGQGRHEQFLKVLDEDPKNDCRDRLDRFPVFQRSPSCPGPRYRRSSTRPRSGTGSSSEANPKNKEAFYTLGVIAWTKAFQPPLEARPSRRHEARGPRPIKDKKVREELRGNVLGHDRGGMKDLEKALAIDSDYDDAMAYVNLLYRQRADLATHGRLQEGHRHGRRLGAEDADHPQAQSRHLAGHGRGCSRSCKVSPRGPGRIRRAAFASVPGFAPSPAILVSRAGRKPRAGSSPPHSCEAHRPALAVFLYNED